MYSFGFYFRITDNSVTSSLVVISGQQFGSRFEVAAIRCVCAVFLLRKFVVDFWQRQPLLRASFALAGRLVYSVRWQSIMSMTSRAIFSRHSKFCTSKLWPTKMLLAVKEPLQNLNVLSHFFSYLGEWISLIIFFFFFFFFLSFCGWACGVFFSGYWMWCQTLVSFRQYFNSFAWREFTAREHRSNAPE